MSHKYGLSDNVITNINQVFSNFPEIEKVVLYGSRAMGNYRSGSDIDLAVFSNKMDFNKLLEIERKLDKLDLAYMIDLLVFQKLVNEELKSHILHLGKLFYKKPLTEIKLFQNIKH